MSVPRRPFHYMPDEYFDCGIAGEHPAEFLAWITDDEPGAQPLVHIISALIHPTITNPRDQVWNITEEIKKYPERERRYEDEIRTAFERAKQKDWEDVGA